MEGFAVISVNDDTCIGHAETPAVDLGDRRGERAPETGEVYET